MYVVPVSWFVVCVCWSVLDMSSAVYRSVPSTSVYSGFKTNVCCSWINNPCCWNVYIYIEFPHNSLSVPLHVSSIIPSCFVCFNILVFCLIFVARMQIMDCFMYVSWSANLVFRFYPFVLHKISCNVCMLIFKFRYIGTCLCSLCILLPVK